MASAKRIGFSDMGYSLSLDVLPVKLMLKLGTPINIKYRLKLNVKSDKTN